MPQELVETPPSDGWMAARGRVRTAKLGTSLERLEEDHSRVVGLVESVQNHLEQQGARSKEAADALGRLAESLAHLPDASKMQLAIVSRISEQMASDALIGKRLEESLSQLPAIADAQRETMVTIGRRLDASREVTERVVATLDGVNDSVVRVGEAAAATARALEKVRWDAAARDEQLAHVLREQTRRLTMCTAAALVLAFTAAAIALIALFF